MKKMLIITACAALSLVGCATYEGAPPNDSDVIYGTDTGDVPSARGPATTPEPLPSVTAPSGNRLRGVEPAPSHPTEAVPPF